MVMHDEPRVRPTPTAHRASFRITGWVLTGLGAVSSFVGAFILLGPDDQYLGLGDGSTSWRVGDIAPAWGYGLLVVGILALVGGITLALQGRASNADRTAEPRNGWPAFAAHATAFVLVNAFLWLQDLAIGDGLNYAYWITVPWAIGLAAHGVACYVDQRRDVTGPANRS